MAWGKKLAWLSWCSELCSADQKATVQRGSGLDVRGPEWFFQPYCSLWMSIFFECRKRCTNDSQQWLSAVVFWGLNWPFAKTRCPSLLCLTSHGTHHVLTQRKIDRRAKRKLTMRRHTRQSRFLLVWNKVYAFKFSNFLRNSNNKYCFVAL